MPIEAILADARSRIATESEWTQFAIARKAGGIACTPRYADTTQLDCLGSVYKAVQALNHSQVEFNFTHTELQRRMRLAWGYKSTDVDKFNDFRTHKEVLELMGGSGAPDPYNPLPETEELSEYNDKIETLLHTYPGHWYDAADRGSQTTFPVPFMPYGEYLKTGIPRKVFAVIDKAYDYQTTPLDGKLQTMLEESVSWSGFSDEITFTNANTAQCTNANGSCIISAASISDEEEIVINFNVTNYTGGRVHILNYDYAPAERFIQSNEALTFRMIRLGSQTGNLNITFNNFSGSLELIVNRHKGLPLGADDVELHVDTSGAFFHSSRGYIGGNDDEHKWPGFRAPFTRFDYHRPDLNMYRTIHMVIKGDPVTWNRKYRLFNLMDPVSPDQDWYSASIICDAGVFTNGSNYGMAFNVIQEYHTGADGGLPPASRPGYGNWHYDVSFTNSASTIPLEERVVPVMVVSFVSFIHPTLASKDQPPIQWMRINGVNVNYGSRGWTAEEMPDGTPRGFGVHRVGFAMGYTSAKPGVDVNHEMAIRELITHAGIETRAEYDQMHDNLIAKHAAITQYRHDNPSPPGYGEDSPT